MSFPFKKKDLINYSPNSSRTNKQTQSGIHGQRKNVIFVSLSPSFCLFIILPVYGYLYGIVISVLSHLIFVLEPFEKKLLMKPLHWVFMKCSLSANGKTPTGPLSVHIMHTDTRTHWRLSHTEWCVLTHTWAGTAKRLRHVRICSFWFWCEYSLETVNKNSSSHNLPVGRILKSDTNSGTSSKVYKILAPRLRTLAACHITLLECSTTPMLLSQTRENSCHRLCHDDFTWRTLAQLLWE